MKKIKELFNFLGFEVSRVQLYKKSPVKDVMIGQPRKNIAEALDQVIKLGIRPKTVIDVGVANGTFDLYKKFPYAFHLLVEPLVEYEQNLKEICNRYNAEYIMAAANDHSGIATINVHPDLFGSSLLKEIEGSYADGICRKVPSVTIDNLCESRNLKAPYIIKVDVQGSELKVLDGSQNVLSGTELVILEVSLYQFHVDAPEFYDLISYMKNRGFVVYDIFGGHTRPLDDALAQVDIAFVKEYGSFRKNHHWASQEQRERWNIKHL